MRYGPDGDRTVEKQLSHAVLKTVAVDADGFESDHDKYVRHLTQTIHNALGPRAATSIDSRVQLT